eukprot:TRINITY_DN29274_c0_g1_i1.p1 TRINITY_DN29274_c0_g1~~TRINITY_DN29274_c0_g1_i1.p1  ORF type:complete len:225 (+),score=59.62 TRINITY_DN29274_c0_g1_i1:170-844(+)
MCIRDRSVLVPLAGKSLDMEYLAQKGHQVLAVEIVPQAIQEYMAENPSRQLQLGPRAGNFRMFSTAGFIPSETPDGIPAGFCFKMGEQGLGFYQDAGQGQVRFAEGNVFSLPSGNFGKFEACWDRGAFVAIQPSDRSKYGELMKDALQPGGRIFMIGLEHPPMKDGKMGPPYNVDRAEVEKAFGKWFEITEVQRWDVNDSEGWNKRMGTSYFNEVAYLLQRRLD